jgi:preprotein translocase subunit SecY
MANPGEMTSALLRDPRLWAITVGGLAVYGLGSRLWLPGLNPEALKGLVGPVPSADLSIFGVGARPMLFGLALAEMARLAVPPLARWVAVSQNHSERLWRAARIFALALAALQGMEIAKAIEGLDDIAPSLGPMFRLGVVVSIVGATALLILLARIMTEQGIGDGMLVLLAAPFVVHLPNDLAYGVEIVRTGLAPTWAPLALAALVVGAAALLVASTRTARSDGGLDIWPPLLGMIVLQTLRFVVYLLADPLVGAVPPTIRLLVLLAAQGGLIWLFAAWRGRADAADAGPLGAEILVCSGALFLSFVLGVGGPMSGFWLILCVAAGLTVASGKAQVDRGMSGPTPTA